MRKSEPKLWEERCNKKMKPWEQENLLSFVLYSALISICPSLERSCLQSRLPGAIMLLPAEFHVYSHIHGYSTSVPSSGRKGPEDGGGSKWQSCNLYAQGGFRIIYRTSYSPSQHLKAIDSGKALLCKIVFSIGRS